MASRWLWQIFAYQMSLWKRFKVYFVSHKSRVLYNVLYSVFKRNERIGNLGCFCLFSVVIFASPADYHFLRRKWLKRLSRKIQFIYVLSLKKKLKRRRRGKIKVIQKFDENNREFYLKKGQECLSVLLSDFYKNWSSYSIS